MDFLFVEKVYADMMNYPSPAEIAADKMNDLIFMGFFVFISIIISIIVFYKLKKQT